ncbi:hypothetical protein SAMN05216474_0539 [Lishizhenia tianjinensis]|uniref:Lipoprotein n=1 Tax=Lishizhenia tianjinensis TaxID=477690 RepID=A0A1I6XYQ4_9FLAO|nr:hypothetical protein [Lishizhenia tianjinensis]SFT43336.1 hypothetical protein SAMN05216474_0539 [Lishizhenia tianjinensis]
MKTHILVIASIFLIVFMLGCSKEKPSVGKYQGTFTYSTPQGVVETAEIEISASSKNKIIINDSELTKNGKIIEGKIENISFSQFGMDIDGEWSNKLFSKEYFIKGNFTEVYYQGGSQYENHGTFEIKSN